MTQGAESADLAALERTLLDAGFVALRASDTDMFVWGTAEATAAVQALAAENARLRDAEVVVRQCLEDVKAAILHAMPGTVIHVSITALCNKALAALPASGPHQLIARGMIVGIESISHPKATKG